MDARYHQLASAHGPCASLLTCIERLDQKLERVEHRLEPREFERPCGAIIELSAMVCMEGCACVADSR
jgi:hypothetical protein